MADNKFVLYDEISDCDYGRYKENYKKQCTEQIMTIFNDHVNHAAHRAKQNFEDKYTIQEFINILSVRLDNMYRIEFIYDMDWMKYRFYFLFMVDRERLSYNIELSGEFTQFFEVRGLRRVTNEIDLPVHLDYKIANFIVSPYKKPIRKHTSSRKIKIKKNR